MSNEQTTTAASSDVENPPSPNHSQSAISQSQQSFPISDNGLLRLTH